MTSVRPPIDQISADNRFKRIAGRNCNCGGNRAGGRRIYDQRRGKNCGPSPISPQQHRRQRKTRRRPNWRCAGINRGESKAASCQGEIDHSNSDQTAGIANASAEEVTSSHCPPPARNHAKFSSQLRLSKQEITNGEMGFRNGFQWSVCRAAIQRYACRRWVKSAVLTVGRLLPIYPQLQTCRCTALTDAMCQQETSIR